MSYTKGPWQIEAVSDAVRVIVGKGRKKIILARLRPPQLPEEETWENARLMASAPELLESLETLLGQHEARCGCQEVGEVLCPGIAEARAAVAKSQKR